MLDNKNNTMYVDTLIYNEAKQKDTEFIRLDNKSFVAIMEKLKLNLELISELNFLRDYQDDILKIIKHEDFLHNNLILNFSNICEINNNEDLNEIFRFFDSQSLCVVVEPSKNMFLSLDYNSLASKFRNYISCEAINSLSLHDKVQRIALINSMGEILLDEIDNFRKEVIIDCDFEKNPIIFAYSCEALDTIDTGLRVHSKIKM